MNKLINETGEVFTERTYCINAYLRDIEKIPVLNKVEELGLVQKAREGDEMARMVLIVCNLKLAFRIAKKYYSPKISFHDLFCESNEGLIKGVDRVISKWDSSRGFRITALAIYSIYGQLVNNFDFLKDQIKLPYSVAKIIRERKKVFKELQSKNCCDPSEQMILEKLSEKDIFLDRSLLRIQEGLEFVYENNVSFFSTEECSNLLIQKELFIADEDFSADHFVEKEDLKTDALRSLSFLTEKEFIVVSLYYGIESEKLFKLVSGINKNIGIEIKNKFQNPEHEGLTLEEISEIIPFTADRIRQIKEKGVRRLRQSRVSGVLRKYLG